MKVELQKINLDEKSVIQNMMQFYLYDYSDTDKRDINSWGLFEYEYLDSYFDEDEDRVPFFIKLNDIVVGFVLINNHSVLSDAKDVRSIAEFFVMKKYRRIGIGTATVKSVFDSYPGKWEIKIDENNKVALAFWRKCIKDSTNGNYKEKYLKNDKLKAYVEIFNV